jgi:hypothetical protein
LAWAGPAAAAAGPIAGKVINQSAQPLNGIEVCAVVFAPYRETCERTDITGEYSIPGTGPGYAVRFSDPDGVAPSFAPQWFPNKRYPEEGEAVTQAEIEAGVDAKMGPGAEIRGSVLALGSEAPLADVEVCAKATVFRAGELEPCAPSKSDGTFVLSGIGPGSYDLRFMPGEGVNYLTANFPMTFSAGDVKGTAAYLRRGAEFEGTLTDGTTGLPVPEFGGPGRTPTVCALEAFTEVRVKCVPVGAGGEYVIAGLPSEGYVLVFGADTKEDGVDLYPDGYVRQYYHEGEVLFGVAGSVETGLDATLVRGEEIWPEEEADETGGGNGGEEVGGTTGGGTTTFETSSPNLAGGAPVSPPPIPVTSAFPHRTVLPKYTCRKGFHRVVKDGQSRCLKIKKKPKKHRPTKHHRGRAD